MREQGDEGGRRQHFQIYVFNFTAVPGAGQLCHSSAVMSEAAYVILHSQVLLSGKLRQPSVDVTQTASCGQKELLNGCEAVCLAFSFFFFKLSLLFQHLHLPLSLCPVCFLIRCLDYKALLEDLRSEFMNPFSAQQARSGVTPCTVSNSGTMVIREINDNRLGRAFFQLSQGFCFTNGFISIISVGLESQKARWRRTGQRCVKNCSK